MSVSGANAGSIDEVQFNAPAREVNSDRVRTDFTKLFLDGVPTTKTAGFLTPYLSENGTTSNGLVYNTTTELLETLRRYRKAGRHSNAHCTGD
jgi:predicted amidohydrolase YtcJ